ncbi:hypothetical protein Poly51_46370 [Rubripirellula tenax]|uniref:H repeat-associated protein N-terminal domain-containing protein n=1 Tax=Rubripirellula tenax TaxID=2528015 RepID=A0A5C6EJK9_9BACT|nr:ISAs1 family transposase [Rubripirellula tenax]TWU48734.1 hypothetical protein Poly51_46370 [Rubripirellula tenax]
MNSPAAIVCKSFVNVTDPRAERGHNHDLLEVIFITLTATICGANSWTDVERFANGKIKWFRRYIKLENGVPSHDTLGRIFSRLDTGEFLAAMHHWVDQFARSLRGKGIAIDGKVLRGSFDRAAAQSPLHTMAAFATETRLVIRQLSGIPDEKLTEDVLSLSQAARELHGRPHPSTIWRWAKRGVNGVKLETIRIGSGRIYTSKQSVARFLEATQESAKS